MFRSIFGLQSFLDALLDALFDRSWCSPGMLEGDACVDPLPGET